MRSFIIVMIVSVLSAVAARAQEPRPAPADSAQVPADTLAPGLREADRDTTETLEELERRLTEELGRADTTDGQPAVQPGGQTRSALNPDISAIGDFLADLSPDEATLEGGDRFQIREVEVGLQGAVDPYFRFDVFLGFHPEEVEVEEAFATTLSLPANLQAKLGSFTCPSAR